MGQEEGSDQKMIQASCSARFGASMAPEQRKGRYKGNRLKNVVPQLHNPELRFPKRSWQERELVGGACPEICPAFVIYEGCFDG